MEGFAREIVHTVQNARRSAGLRVEDRIELALAGDEALIAAAEAHREHIAAETLAVQLTLSSASAEAPAGFEHSEQTAIDGLPLRLDLRRITPS